MAKDVLRNLVNGILVGLGLVGILRPAEAFDCRRAIAIALFGERTVLARELAEQARAQTMAQIRRQFETAKFPINGGGSPDPRGVAPSPPLGRGSSVRRGLVSRIGIRLGSAAPAGFDEESRSRSRESPGQAGSLRNRPGGLGRSQSHRDLAKPSRYRSLPTFRRRSLGPSFSGSAHPRAISLGDRWDG